MSTCPKVYLLAPHVVFKMNWPMYRHDASITLCRKLYNGIGYDESFLNISVHLDLTKSQPEFCGLKLINKYKFFVL